MRMPPSAVELIENGSNASRFSVRPHDGHDLGLEGTEVACAFTAGRHGSIFYYTSVVRKPFAVYTAVQPPSTAST